MINRNAALYLNDWLKKSRRKPLILRGARQVGKSTLVREFAKSAGLELLEINLERHPVLDTVFRSLDVVRICREIEGLLGRRIEAANSLLFLDEIQATPHALAALRYFYEEMPELPVVAAGTWQGWDGLYAQLGIFFSKAAVVTFGGAYAVLPYVGQQAVENYGWVTAPQMLHGLALAETTPGPLILVLQYVGFLAGWANPGGLSPLGAATLGSAMTTWVTFVPTYLFILVGAPYVERLRGNVRLSAALAAVTAAVVGVILNLALWFGWHAIWPAGRGGGVDGWMLVGSGLAFAALHWGRVGLGWVVLGAALAGWGWSAWA
jgi:chromate transport protein ChrA